jgi:hypothetical protein
VRRGEANYYFDTGPAVLGPTIPEVVLLGGWESPAYFNVLHRARKRSVPTVGFANEDLAAGLNVVISDASGGAFNQANERRVYRT